MIARGHPARARLAVAEEVVRLEDGRRRGEEAGAEVEDDR